MGSGLIPVPALTPTPTTRPPPSCPRSPPPSRPRPPATASLRPPTTPSPRPLRRPPPHHRPPPRPPTANTLRLVLVLVLVFVLVLVLVLLLLIPVLVLLVLLRATPATLLVTVRIGIYQCGSESGRPFLMRIRIRNTGSTFFISLFQNIISVLLSLPATGEELQSVRPVPALPLIQNK